ncbi:MAG TPA: hypothetical protein VIK11_14480 [Tepidiformaceae bacterium]
MSFLTRFRRWGRTSAAVLYPRQSDVRAVGPESGPTENAATAKPAPTEPAGPEHVSPDAKELEREHRGY